MIGILTFIALTMLTLKGAWLAAFLVLVLYSLYLAVREPGERRPLHPHPVRLAVSYLFAIVLPFVLLVPSIRRRLNGWLTA